MWNTASNPISLLKTVAWVLLLGAYFTTHGIGRTLWSAVTMTGGALMVGFGCLYGYTLFWWRGVRSRSVPTGRTDATDGGSMDRRLDRP